MRQFLTQKKKDKTCFGRGGFTRIVNFGEVSAGSRNRRVTKQHASPKSTTGFTLVETLVAITVLAVSIAGPMTIASKGLQSAVFAKNQVIAAFIAQDGMEFIRHARDSNILSGDSWLSGLGACLYQSGDPEQWCTVDTVGGVPTRPQTFMACSGSGAETCEHLRYDETSGLYEHDRRDPVSIYIRSVSIEQINSDEVVVRVVVLWEQGGFSREFTVQENLFNWF